jgi:hypothetical protein
MIVVVAWMLASCAALSAQILPPSTGGCQPEQTQSGDVQWTICPTAVLKHNYPLLQCPAGGRGISFDGITYARIGENWPVGSSIPPGVKVSALEMAKALAGAYSQCDLQFNKCDPTPTTSCDAKTYPYWCSDSIIITGWNHIGSPNASGFVGGLGGLNKTDQSVVLAKYFGQNADTWVVLGTGDLENLVDKCSNQLVCPVPLFSGDPHPIPDPDALISTSFVLLNQINGTGTNTCDPTLELLVPFYDTTKFPAQVTGYAVSYDATSLEIDFVSKYDYILFNYVFSSDEYPEYVNTGYNDVFALFLNDQNVALLPGSLGVVSIDNVNIGNVDINGNPNPDQDPTKHNPQFFLDNRKDSSWSNSLLPLEMDGLTFMPPDSKTGNRSPMTAQGRAIRSTDPTKPVINKLRFAITDVGDSLADSFVMFMNPSLISTSSLINQNTLANASTAPTDPTCPHFAGTGLVASRTSSSIPASSFDFNIYAATPEASSYYVTLHYTDSSNAINITINNVPSLYRTDNSSVTGPGITVFAPCVVSGTGATAFGVAGNRTCRISVVDNGDSGSGTSAAGVPADIFSLSVETTEQTVFYSSDDFAKVSVNISSCMKVGCPASTGIAGTSYNSTATAAYGIPPYTYSWTSTSGLPPGLLLNSSTGAIAGIPQSPGTYDFTIGASYSGAPPPPSSANCSIAVGQVACSTPATNDTTFNSTAIAYNSGDNSGNNYIWFNSNMSVSGLGKTAPTMATTILFQNSSILLTDARGNTVATIAVPDSIVTFSSDPDTTCAFASFDDVSRTWNVYVPWTGSDEVFLTGVAYPVPSGGLPGGLKASWRGIFRTSSPGITVQWRWGAAVYKKFTSDASLLSVRPTHTGACTPPYSSTGHAGTPERYADPTQVIAGATSGRSCSSDFTFTGSWSSTQSVKFCPTNLPFTTYTQGGWGAPPHGDNPGDFLSDSFSTVYYSGSVTIGGKYSLTFTSASAIEKFLPEVGQPGMLTKAYVAATNPTGPTTPAGVLAGQLLALQLNVDFSNDGFTRGGLGKLYLASGPLAGQTVSQILALANAVVGGDLSGLPAKLSLSDLNNILTNINENYDSGEDDRHYLLANPPTNSPSGCNILKHRANPHKADEKDAFRPGCLTTGSTKMVNPGITYNGGPLITTPAIYYIWYGGWGQKGGSDSADGQSILRDFAKRIGGSAHFSLNSAYSMGTGKITGQVTFGGETTDLYSRGKTLSDADVQRVVGDALSSKRLPYDPNGVYFVLSSSDVSESSGFCSDYCGWRTSGTLNGKTVRYSFVGNPQGCLDVCAPQTKGPNGNAGVDAMVSVVAHQLNEAVTDPDPQSSWFDIFGASNADKCAWTFGHNQYHAKNGALANIKLGDRDFLIQRNLQHTAKGDVCKVDPNHN